MKVAILLTCLVALSRQQQQPPGFGNLGNAFGNAFNAIFTNSANQLTNSVNNRPVVVLGPSVQQRPPVNSPSLFAFRPVPVPNRPVMVAPVVTPVARPTGAPITPAVRPTAVVPITPSTARPAGRRRRTLTEEVVDTPVAAALYTAETPKPSTTEAPSSYWPVPGAGWFYG